MADINKKRPKRAIERPSASVRKGPSSQVETEIEEIPSQVSAVTATSSAAPGTVKKSSTSGGTPPGLSQAITAPEETPLSFANTWADVTVETWSYLVLFLIGAGLRFLLLGAEPLNNHEASLAWEALHFYRGQPADLLSQSPLMFFSTVLSFIIFGTNDVAVRLLAALASSLVVITPGLLHPWLGRLNALVAGSLLAISPIFVYGGRQADAIALTALGSMILLAAALRYARQPRMSTVYTGAIALALMLSAGTGTLTTLALWAIFLLGISMLARRDNSLGTIGQSIEQTWGNRSYLGQGLLILLAAFLALATGFLSDVQGVQASFNRLTAWSATANAPLPILLVIYEPVILLFALLGAIYSFRYLRTSRSLADDNDTAQSGVPQPISNVLPMFGIFLTFWSAGSLVIGLFGNTGDLAGLTSISLPAILLAAIGMGRLIEFLLEADGLKNEWLFVGFSVILWIFVYLRAGAYGVDNNQSFLTSLIGAIGLWIVLIFLYVYLMGWPVAMRGAGLMALGIGVLLMFHATWNLNFRFNRPPHELLAPEQTTTEIRRLSDTLAQIFNDRDRSRYLSPVTVDARLLPLAGWYLKDFEHLSISNGEQVTTPAAVWGPGDPPQMTGVALSQRFRVLATWQYQEMGMNGWVRWFISRESPAPVNYREYILYINR
ncbi:MAG: hypothetical protein HY326_03200 [Chloroflexi bacterium]|nr:hypothetical protein [Chloroflexota bacterium]